MKTKRRAVVTVTQQLFRVSPDFPDFYGFNHACGAKRLGGALEPGKNGDRSQNRVHGEEISRNTLSPGSSPPRNQPAHLDREVSTSGAIPPAANQAIRIRTSFIACLVYRPPFWSSRRISIQILK